MYLLKNSQTETCVRLTGDVKFVVKSMVGVIYPTSRQEGLNTLIMYKADQNKVFEPLAVAVVSDFRNHLCCSSVYILFYQCLVESVGPDLYCIFEMWMV